MKDGSTTLLSRAFFAMVLIIVGTDYLAGQNPTVQQELSGTTKADFRPASSNAIEGKEESYWISPSAVEGKGQEVILRSVFQHFMKDAMKNAVARGPILPSDPGYFFRAGQYQYPWQKLPVVHIGPLGAKVKPGTKNYALFQKWEANKLSGMSYLSSSESSGSTWPANSGEILGMMYSPVAQTMFHIDDHGKVIGLIWVIKRRERKPESKLVCQLLDLEGRLEGADSVGFSAEGLRGHFRYVGRGYALEGEFAGKPIEALLHPDFDQVWRETVKRAGKKPTPQPSYDNFGVKFYE